MVPESQPLSKTLESFISRLLQGVSRSPLLKAFPTKTVKRIDLERLRIITDDAPERLIAGLIGPSGQVRLQFERFAASGKDGEESRELFTILKTKLSRGAQLIFRETGLRTLWLAFPILYVPYPDGDPGEFLLAPLFLWPLQIFSSGMKEGELVIARDPDGGPPRFNRVAMQWIRRYLDFDPAEPSAADVRDVGSVANVEALCRTLCESFQPPVNVVLAGSIGPIPTRVVLSGQNKPALFNSALVGLIQWENQELIRDLEDLSKMGDLNGAAADLLRGIEQKAPSCLSVPEEVDRYFVTDTDVSQERAVWDRCHPLSSMSERKDVYDGAAASLSMQQPLVGEINPMNHATTNCPASCENCILFRHGPLLPKITNPRSSRPSVDLFVKILAPITNPYRYKRANKAPYPPACQ